MTETKPRFKIVAGRPVSDNGRETPVQAARRRFGQKFAHEPGATWRPRGVPVLLEWLQRRGKA